MAISQDLGRMGESYIFNLLKEKGIEAEWAPFGRGPDFITKSGLNLDVKYSNPYIYSKDTKKNGVREYKKWTFNFHHHGKPQSKVDFFICILNNDGDFHIYVIPQPLHAEKQILTISGPQFNSGKFDYFKDNFDLIKSATI